MAAGPGLKKAHAPTLFRERWVRLVALTEGRVRDLVERADVLSEGGVRDEGGVPTYYGTTSIVLALEWTPEMAPEIVLHALRYDPHVRLRIVRIAHREAASRIVAATAAVHHEIAIELAPPRITITVDVVARLAAATTAMGG